MDWLRKFMYGRYGVDELSIFLVITSIVVMVIGRIFYKIPFITIISDIIIILYLFRIFSKNISKRQQENYKYIQLKNRILYRFQKKKSNVIDMKSFKILKCPECGQKLRVPRKKGKITVTCSKCRKEFKAKS